MSSKKKALNRSCWVNLQTRKGKQVSDVFHRPNDADFIKNEFALALAADANVNEDESEEEWNLKNLNVRKMCRDISRPVIISKVLVGEVSKQVDKGVTKLPNSAKSDIVQLSPETMTRCGLCIGQPAVVSSTGPDAPAAICLVWPVIGFPAASVGFHDDLQMLYGWRDGDLVRVEALSGDVALAAAVRLIAKVDRDVSFLETPEFLNFVTRSLISKHIVCGSLFSLTYYGKPVVLEIDEVTAQSSMVPSQSNQSLTSNSMSSAKQLDRTDVTNCSFNEARTPSLDESISGNGKYTQESESAAPCLEDKTNSPLDDSSNLDCSGDLENRFHSLNLSETSIVSSSTPMKALDMSRSRLGEKTLDSSVLCVSHHASEERGVYRIARTTGVTIASSCEEKSRSKEEEIFAKLGGRVTFDMIGGLVRQLKAIRDLVQAPLKNPDIFRSLGIPPPRGVLLYGPPGVGKTLLARAVACETGVHTVVINGPEVLSKYYGESEARLRAMFNEASQNAPSLILIDELDALCPRRERAGSDLERRIVSMLLTLMDGISQSQSTGGHVLVLGATCRPDSIDSALRRPGRFDREIEIGVPNARERRQILEKLMASMSHGLKAEEIGEIADAGHGYVGADLTAVCKEAAMSAFERLRAVQSPSSLGIQDGRPTSFSGSITKEDFLHALTQVKPSALREVEIDIPKVLWTDIGGQENIKLKLRQAVEWPIKHPEAFERLGVSPPRGVLLYGPPGCSKTLIAKALATESGLNFISVKGPELFSKFVGDSERAVREVFRKARSAAPSIVFFDEIDGIAVERGSSSGGSSVGDRVLGQLLTELDGVEGLRDVVVVAATNRPDMIDKALMRPGRLDRILYVSLPDDHTRREILDIQFRKIPVAADCALDKLVEQTQGYSGAEVVAVCREASLAAMQESLDIREVSQRHFDVALTSVQPQTTRESIQFYEEYQKKSGLNRV